MPSASAPSTRPTNVLRRNEYDARLARERDALDAVGPISTREQWLAATDPFPMLALVQDVVPDAELRAFCCACCRRMWLTNNTTEAVALDALRIAEGFATGQASREELHAAHQAIARHAEAAGDRFARVNMRLGDSTDEWDYRSALCDYEFAQALTDVTDNDIGDAAFACISHALEVVRADAGFASKEASGAKAGEANASEAKALAVMIRERWPYPTESTDSLREIRRFREFRLALAAQQRLSDQLWKVVNMFAARLDGAGRETLKQLCREQIAALSMLLPAATVQHILFDDLTRLLGVPAQRWGARPPQWHGLSRRQLIALPNARIGELIADDLEAAPPGALERWCCSLFVDQLTALTLRRMGTPPADPVWPVAATDLANWFRESLSTLPALPPKRPSWQFWRRA
jgi:hypothetical protein